MLAVSTQTKGRNLSAYNRFELFEDVVVLVANDVMFLGEELVISLRRKFPRRLHAHVNKEAACPVTRPLPTDTKTAEDSV